jgi:uncharacterized membrane protein YjdF
VDRLDAVLFGFAAFLSLFLVASIARAYELQRWADAQGQREAAFLAELAGE